jgi:hypothetical protein
LPNCTDEDMSALLYTFDRLSTDDLAAFESRIGYPFQQREILTRALTHKSYSHEAKNDALRDNETNSSAIPCSVSSSATSFSGVFRSLTKERSRR